MPEQREYKVTVRACGQSISDYSILADSAEEAVAIVKKELWNFTITIEVEVQGELNIVKEVIRER